MKQDKTDVLSEKLENIYTNILDNVEALGNIDLAIIYMTNIKDHMMSLIRTTKALAKLEQKKEKAHRQNMKYDGIFK